MVNELPSLHKLVVLLVGSIVSLCGKYWFPVRSCCFINSARIFTVDLGCCFRLCMAKPARLFCAQTLFFSVRMYLFDDYFYSRYDLNKMKIKVLLSVFFCSCVKRKTAH